MSINSWTCQYEVICLLIHGHVRVKCICLLIRGHVIVCLLIRGHVRVK